MISGVPVSLFTDDTWLQATAPNDGYILSKLQRGISALKSWCEVWNAQLIERSLRQLISWRDVECLRKNFSEEGGRMTRRHVGVDIIAVKGWCTYTNCFYKHVSPAVKATFHRQLISPVTMCICPVLQSVAETPLLKLQNVQQKVFWG